MIYWNSFQAHRLRGQTNRKKGMANVIYIQQADNPIKQRL